MVIETIAGSAMALLGPYLLEGGKGLAKTAGAVLATKAEALYEVVKNKFADDKDAEQTLAQVEAKPKSKPRQSSMEEMLLEKMRADSDFAMIVTRLVQEARSADTKNTLNLAGDRNIVVSGGISGGTFITGDANRFDKD